MSSLSKLDLTLEELAVLESEMLKKRKNKDAAWGLWAGLSFFGAHRFYTEDYKYASAMLLTSAIPLIAIIIMLFSVNYYYFDYGFNSMFLFLSIFLLAGSVIWSWIDAFFLNRRIDAINDSIESSILKDIREERNISKKATF